MRDNCANSISEYAEKLPFDIQARYLDKITLINSESYKVITCKYETWESNPENIPNVNYLYLYEYFVLRKSEYTHEQFKAYKSVSVYDQFISGWIKTV